MSSIFLEPEQFLDYNYQIPTGVVYEYGADNQYFLEQNKKEQPVSWRYHNDRVRYDLNNHGYRCPEFSDIDWNNSIVVFGCSLAMGMAVDQSEIFTTLLQESLRVPVINLGVCSTSVIFSLINQTRLAEQNFLPKAVINIWTYPNRILQACQDNKFTHHGPWTSYYKKWDQTFYEVNSTDDHVMFMTKEHIRMANVLWKDTIHLQCTFSGLIKNLGIHHYEITDYGRDLAHPGHSTHQKIAEHLTSLLQAQGF